MEATDHLTCGFGVVPPRWIVDPINLKAPLVGTGFPWHQDAAFIPPDYRALFPPQLARPDVSGVVREVKPGQENVFDFAVEVNGG